jgi:hypothetical protein
MEAGQAGGFVGPAAALAAATAATAAAVAAKAVGTGQARTNWQTGPLSK